MIDWTKPVQTRDGREVWMRRHPDGSLWRHPESTYYPHVGYVDADGLTAHSYTEAGEYLSGDTSSFDLINVPEPVQFYLNVYAEHVACRHSRREADEWAGNNARLALLRLHNTNGKWEVEEVE